MVVEEVLINPGNDSTPTDETRTQEQQTQQTVVANDFAAELLYVMRAAGDMLTD